MRVALCLEHTARLLLPGLTLLCVCSHHPRFHHFKSRVALCLQLACTALEIEPLALGRCSMCWTIPRYYQLLSLDYQWIALCFSLSSCVFHRSGSLSLSPTFGGGRQDGWMDELHKTVLRHKTFSTLSPSLPFPSLPSLFTSTSTNPQHTSQSSRYLKISVALPLTTHIQKPSTTHLSHPRTKHHHHHCVQNLYTLRPFTHTEHQSTITTTYYFTTLPSISSPSYLTYYLHYLEHLPRVH